MDSLPFNILDEILFKLDPKSLAMMKYTDRSIRSHISDDPSFNSEYLSRLGSDLFHISTFGSNIFFWHSSGDSRSTRNKKVLQLQHRILGSCSGLLLLFVDGLCVKNPLTNTSRFLDHSGSKLLPYIISRGYKRFQLKRDKANRIGFAVDQIDQRFKIVCINELKASNLEETMYQFEISNGDSCWRLSETTITCRSSDLMPDKKPVYFDRYVHWLRKDGSILAFNPVTEQARLIPIKLPQKQSSEVIMLAASDNELTLITATEEGIYVYALENILTDHPKWVLVKGIEEGEKMRYWNVTAYDGKCLVVREKKEERYNGVVHVYDLRPDKRISSLSMIMRLIGGISPHDLKLLQKKKKLLRKRLIGEEENILKMGVAQRLNKRIRSLLVNE